MTDAAGAFLLTAPRAGRYRLHLARIGYAATTTQPIDPREDEELEVEVHLFVEAVPVAPLTVLSDRPALLRSPRLAFLGFYEEDPIAYFLDAWDELEGSPLTYGARESWEGLRRSGGALLHKFLTEELERLGAVASVEKAFELAILGLELPFIGTIDLVASVDGTPTVIDFKTSGGTYPAFEANLSDQLSAYQLAEPETEQAALCVLVKTKTPKIEWHVRPCSGPQLLDYLRKAKLITRASEAEEFYKRPGRWCGWCDFLPVCTGDARKAEETLMRVDPSA